MDKITEKTLIKKIRDIKEFKPFRDFLFVPFNLRGFIDSLSLSKINLIYKYDVKDSLDSLNYLLNLIKSKGQIFKNLNNQRTGYFSYVIDQNKPSVIVLPGGGYRDVSNLYEGFPVAKRLNELGYNAYIIHYSFGKNAVYPNPIEDLKDFFMDLKNQGIVLKHYSIVGFSAGAHLAGLWASKQYGYLRYGLLKPESLMLIYPVISLAENANYDSRMNFLGKNHHNKELQNQFSINNLVDEDYPTVFMWQCIDDHCVPIENSKAMERALISNEIPYEYHLYEGSDHGTGLAKNKEQNGWLEKALSFWKNHPQHL